MYRKYFKRAIDIVVSILVFPIFIIAFIPVAIIIKLEDGGPIFYNGKRLGKDLVEFKMHKFRTMKLNVGY